MAPARAEWGRVVHQALTIGSRDQGTHLSYRQDGHVQGVVIYAGTAPYFAYSVLYDPRKRALGLKPRAPYLPPRPERPQ